MESQTKVAGHSAHQITIVWPLGLLSTSVLYDIAAVRGSEKAGRTAFSMLGAGLLGGLVAAPLGFNDWRAIPTGTRARSVGVWHGLSNAVALTLFGASWLLRRSQPEKPSSLAVTLSATGGGLAFLGGWLGGELVDRLGVGVDEGAHLNSPNSLSGRPASENADQSYHKENTNMATHSASVTINAPVHQVYQLFTHFNDFPKFMSFVKEVTYQDSQNSHWVANVLGDHEWNAVNENWIPDKQVGWRSTNGLENNGTVTFQSEGSSQTRVTVTINVNPPAGVAGDAVEALGGGKHFDAKLEHDLNHFAQMVAQAPTGALDPESSNYLFHDDSAAAKGKTTDAQDATMDQASVVNAS